MALRPGVLAGALSLVAAAACRAPAGTVEMSWTGSDTGEVVLAARAGRCADGPVELIATSGDTGIAIALFGARPLAAGSYPVSVGAADSVPPAATVGARWLDSAAVAGYRGLSGAVSLSEANPELTGRFTVEARPRQGSGLVQIIGAIRSVPVDECPRAGDVLRLMQDQLARLD